MTIILDNYIFTIVYRSYIKGIAITFNINNVCCYVRVKRIIKL